MNVYALSDYGMSVVSRTSINVHRLQTAYSTTTRTFSLDETKLRSFKVQERTKDAHKSHRGHSTAPHT